MIQPGNKHTVGLCADGTVLVTKSTDKGKSNDPYDVSDWTDIVAVAASGEFTLGLRADGTVVAAGAGKRDVSGWKLFNSFDTLEAERKAALEKANSERMAAEKAEAERKERIRKLSEEKAALQNELANLRGLFSGGRRRELEARLAKLDAELKTLN